MCEKGGLQQQQKQPPRSCNYPTSLKTIASDDGLLHHNTRIEIETSSSSSLSSTALQQDYLPGRCTGSEQSIRACRPNQTSSEIGSQTPPQLRKSVGKEDTTSTATGSLQQQIISDLEVDPISGVAAVKEQVMSSRRNKDNYLGFILFKSGNYLELF